ncbi:MAG: hypothetical protein KC561_02595 [Myxococcales bacterium]|nr:hypothetical protein [Myxococcales bacterium]
MNRMMCSFAVLLVVCASAVLSSRAQEGSGEETSSAHAGEGTGEQVEGTGDAAAAEGSGAAAVQDAEETFEGVVRVRRVVDADRTEPVGAGVTVTMNTVVPPNGITATTSAETDEAGEVRFDLPANRDAFFVAGADLAGLVVQAEAPIQFLGSHETVVTTYRTTGDPSGLVISRLDVVVEPVEGFLTFTQQYILRTGDLEVFSPDLQPEEERGVRIPLPEGATGVRVLFPEEEAEAGETEIILNRPIVPTPPDQRAEYDLVVVFSLPLESSYHQFRQSMAFPIEDVEVMVPLLTTHTRHPVLDVSLAVPGCPVDEMVCFPPQDAETRSDDIAPNLNRRTARLGQSEGPAELVFETWGWPAADKKVQWAAGAAILAVLFGGIVLVSTGGGERRSSPLQRRQLARRTDELLRDLKYLRSQYELGRIPQSEFDAQELQLMSRLDRMYRVIAGGSEKQTGPRDSGKPSA